MGRRGPFRWSLALAVVFVAQQALAGEGVCRSGCRGASQTFKYTQGTTYKYNYEGKIDISLSSAEGQVTSTEVKAIVLLTQLADCNQLLRLQNVQILGSNGKKIGNIPDVEKPIRINFHDGHIEDSICIEAGDTQNSLNIKRAIASMFQVSLRGGHETDVFGVCATEVAHHQDGNVIDIQKSRDLNKCAHRENIRQDFFTTTFNLHSEVKSSPILNGDYTARLRVKAGILEQSKVVENYLFTPFSVGKNGAKAQVTSKMQLTGTSKDNPTSKCSKPRSIIFENPHPVIAPTSNVNIILNTVKEVVKTIDVVVGEQTAKEFVTLVKTVRGAKKGDLLAVYNQVKSGIGFGDKAVAKKVFLDALLQSATGETIEVTLTLLKNNEFNEYEKNLVYIGMSLVRHATESSLNTAATLLGQRNLPNAAYLGIGNLAGRYCQQHSCENVDAVNKLIQKLVQKLGDGKPANRVAENEMIFVLKALKNIGHLSDSILQKIISIAQNKQAPNRLRAAVLETYLADPCKDKLRNSALTILQDIQQDAEVRIKAYLAVAQCPNAKIGNAVKALLQKEPSYQVGGFIASHIRSIKASANPDKDLAKQYLGFSITKKFPIDWRKWSYNGEFSYAVDTLGVAASSEANIIYSQDSFLPRSTSLNLTAELFGHSFNFLEIQTRQENLDKLVEHYFGPKGVFRTSKFEDLIKKYDEFLNGVVNLVSKNLDQTLREKRDVSRAEIENIGKTVQIKENALNRDLDLDLSVKAFGSELLFTNLNANHKGVDPEDLINNIFAGFKKGLDNLKNFKETLRSNILFLDVEFDYPTGLGFPLRLAAEGTSNIQVDADVKADVRGLLNGRNTEIHVKLIPSANIEVTGRLTLDALVVENGLKVVSNLYTCHGGDLTVNLFNGLKDIDVKFGLPVQEEKIISATHEIVFHTRDQAGHESNAPLKFAQAKDFSICMDHLSPFIGLAFCGEINGPNLAGKDMPVLPFPLAGDAKIAITIENEDVKEYHLRNILDLDYPRLEFVIETIGKNNQKKCSFEVNAELYKEKYIKAAFTSPLKTAYAEARITSNEIENSLMAKVGHDQMEFYGKIGVSISGSPQRSFYRPIFEFVAPGGERLNVEVQGQIIVEQGNTVKYTFDDVKVILPNGEFVNVKGYVGNDATGDAFADLTVSDGQQSGTFKGRLHSHYPLLKFNAEFQNTINPIVNFNIKGEFKNEYRDTQNSIQLIHGSDLASKINKISWSNSITRKYNNPQDFSYGIKNDFSYPLVGVNFEFESEQKPKSFDYDIDIQYNEIKFGSDFEVEIDKKQQGDFNVQFEIHGLENKVELKAERQVQGDESNINNELEINGKRLEVKGKIKHQIKPSNVDIGADLTIILPTHSTPFKVISGLKYNPNEVDAQHKVTSGSTVVIDAFIKANKQGNANGSFKVNMKGILNVNGHVKANKGSGSGELLINALKLKKQVKFESTFQVQPPTTYNVVLTIYPSFEQDKNQKIILSTHNKITTTLIDSKSSANLLGKILQVNVKGTKSGDPEKEKINGEFEVSFPNDQYLLGKVSCDHENKNDFFNGQYTSTLEYRKNKNTAGRKVSFRAKYKDTKPSEGIYDVIYNLAADDSNGNNINADVGFKRSKSEEQTITEISNEIHGSILKSPFKNNLKFKTGSNTGSAEVSSTYGETAGIKIGANYATQIAGKPCLGEIAFQLITPSKSLKTLKVGVSGSILRPQSLSEAFEIKGAGSIFADDDGSTADPIIDFKADGLVKASDKEGAIEGNVNYGKLGPISAAAGYRHNGNGKQSQLNGNVALQYGKSKNFKAEASLSKPDDRQYKIDAELQTPYEEFKKTVFSVQTKHSEDQKHVTSKVVVNTDGKVWNFNTELQTSDIAPFVDFNVKYPDGKLAQFYLKGNKVSDKEFGGEVKISCQRRNFLLEGKIDINIDDIEQFAIKANINSPNLNINKYSIEAHNKPGKTANRIQVVIKSANKNIVTGSTNYHAREEQGKYIVEGSGTFKIKEESKSANFKYIGQRLSFEKNGEQGLEISFDAGIGDRALDAEFKFTNKQFRILNSYCEKNKECAHVEIDTKVNSHDLNSYNQVLEITVDLRKIGLSHEFGLKAETTRKDLVFDHTLDAHFQNQENSKYQYSVYLHPQRAGVSLTTPKRTISLEANAQIPEDFRQGGKVSGDITFYLDKKNNPNKKASVDGWFTFDEQHTTINGETKLVHPGLLRPLSVSVRTVRVGTPSNGQVSIITELDIFEQPAQKIVAVYKGVNDVESTSIISFKENLDIRSTGLGIDVECRGITSFDKQTYEGEHTGRVKYHVGNSNYDNVVSMKGSRTQLNFLFRLLSVDLIKIFNQLNINNDQQVIDSEISSFDDNPLLSHLEIKNFNTILYTIGLKNTPREKLQFNAGLIPGQIADVRTDHVTGQGKINLFHATVKLDEANFLKPDYSINSNEIEKVLVQGQQKFTSYLNGLQNVGKEWSNNIRKEVTQLGDLSKGATPNLQPLRQYYASELDKIKQELLQDKSLNDIAYIFNNVFGAITNGVLEIFSTLSQLVEGIAHSIESVFAGVIDSIEKELLPQLREVAEKLIAVTADIAKTLVDITASCLATISKLVEKYQPEIKQIVAIFGELSQDVARFTQKFYEEIKEIFIEIIQKINDELEALPIVEELKLQYQELIKFGVPERDAIIRSIKEITSTVKDLIPPELIVQEEIKRIIDLTVQYIEKKLKQEPVDDFAYLDQLISINISVVKKMLNLLSAPALDVPQGQVPISLDFFKKLPNLVAIKFSPISYLLKEDTSDAVIAFALSLFDSPRHWVPPFPLFSMVVQGQHIFTFDGKHLTFPGNCKYLLARDAVNGNFTIIATYANGHLSAITLADPHDSITVKKGGQAILNNAATELPARKPDLAAFRGYEMINLQSTAGVKISCSPDLEGCSILISGFYHGQVKGLLGNGNNEPYDDFTIPNGKIVTAESDFGNSYKIGNCQPVTVPKHHQENPICKKLFGWESPMRYCFPFVPTENFKTACTHGLASGVKDTEVNIARAYVAACRYHNIPVNVPSDLVKCTNSEKPFGVGDKFSVKVPGKAADIVLVVDTSKTNELIYKEFYQPLVQDIVKILQAKGISDVQFHLIIYGGENQWPTHVTVGGKLNFKGKAPNLKFWSKPEKDRYSPMGYLSAIRYNWKFLEKFLDDIKLGVGQDLRAQTFTEAYFYPFRSNALKSMVIINSKPCEVGSLFLLQKLRTLLYKNNQITLNLITPFESFEEKYANKTKDIIGFNDNHVFTVSQAKKKPEGSAELYKDLDYNDYCVDFTVKNRGNVFVTNTFESAKPEVKKQFIHVAAYNIVDQLLNVEEGLDCECTMLNPYQAYNVCEEAYSKEKK